MQLRRAVAIYLTQRVSATASAVPSPYTTIAAATRYSVSGVPVPSSFSIPSSWRGPIPDWPAGCRNGQLEDNGRWNCQ